MSEAIDHALLQVQGEMDALKSQRNRQQAALREAREIIRLIGTVDANSSDNIRRAQKWLDDGERAIYLHI